MWFGFSLIVYFYKKNTSKQKCLNINININKVSLSFTSLHIHIYYIYIYIYVYIYIYIYIYIFIYENNREITGWKSKSGTKVTHNQFRWCCFSSGYKCYHFVLVVWRCLGIKCQIDVILRTTTLGGFAT